MANLDPFTMRNPLVTSEMLYLINKGCTRALNEHFGGFWAILGDFVKFCKKSKERMSSNGLNMYIYVVVAIHLAADAVVSRPSAAAGRSLKNLRRNA